MNKWLEQKQEKEEKLKDINREKVNLEEGIKFLNKKIKLEATNVIRENCDEFIKIFKSYGVIKNYCDKEDEIQTQISIGTGHYIYLSYDEDESRYVLKCNVVPEEFKNKFKEMQSKLKAFMKSHLLE